MLKRIVNYNKLEDGKLLVVSISNPIDDAELPTDISERVGLINTDYIEPIKIEGKIAIQYYNIETQSINVEYRNITSDDMTITERLDYLQNIQNEYDLLMEVINKLSKSSKDSILSKFNELKEKSKIVVETEVIEEKLLIDNKEELHIEQINSSGSSEEDVKENIGDE